jgi:hypothetical protein
MVMGTLCNLTGRRIRRGLCAGLIAAAATAGTEASVHTSAHGVPYAMPGLSQNRAPNSNLSGVV